MTDNPSGPADNPPGPAGNPSGAAGPDERDVLKARLTRLEMLLGKQYRMAGEAAHLLPAWLRRTSGEPRLAVSVAVLAMVGLQLLVSRFVFQPYWLLPALQLLLFVVLVAANPRRITRESRMLRGIGLLLVLAASVGNAWAALVLVNQLAHGGGPPSAPLLLRDGGAIWLTNVIIFALWYWELDRGGPAARAAARHVHPDFLFSQMTAPELARHDWEPGFVDYFYLSFTNATAFSPTDTLPLSQWAKLAMMFQSGVSLGTVALVVARAVNIIGG